MTKSLRGKTALVTGGARGIGAAIARALADEGAAVALSYMASGEKADALVAELITGGVPAAAFQANQADSAQVTGLIQKVKAHFGQLDILVNNAGVAVGGAVVDPAPDRAAIERMYAVNYFAVVAAIREAALVMGEGGRIITIGSVLGDRASFPGLADYAATKAAVTGFSKGAARDLGPRGITVNVIRAGSVATDMNPAEGASAEAQKALSALGRFATPAQIAAGVVFLASPAAAYVTGSELVIDGGFGA